MTTMTAPDMINDYAFVRQVIGYAKQGVMILPQVRQHALDKFLGLQQQEIIDPAAVHATNRVLEHLRTGILPQATLCRDAMTEIDQFLLPMRRDQRAAESMIEQRYERQRG
ncbi:hypothetical protein [Ramlibacter sp. AN1133]|uniref:hypothetical protein n=1 Tax=Ramlibacter sp. AN1133 TaxID=3133429 RepID=UPI0030BEA03A